MGVRSRVVSSALIGGLMTGALVLGAPAAEAKTVNASCGGSVTAAPGDTIVTPLGSLGSVGSASKTLSSTLGVVLCKVNVTVVKPVASAAGGAASGVKSGADAAGGAVKGAAGSLKGGSTPAPSAGGTRTATSAAAPTSATTPGAGSTPAPAAGSTGGGSAVLADAPMSPAFAPMFTALPSSFLALAAPGASAISTGFYDPSLLLGGAPMYRVGIPSLLGDPTTAVTSASQLQALPIDGLGGGFGVPAVLVVLLAAGAAALGVRRAILGRRVLPGREELSRLLHRSTGEGTAGS